MKAKRKDLLELWKLINNLRGTQYNIKFSYFLAKNRKRIQSEVEILDETVKPSDAYTIYDNERASTANRFSDKDPDGKPVIVNSNYMITEKLEEFNKEINNLKEKHKNVIDERDKQNEDYDKLLDEEVEFDGYAIKMCEMPDRLDAVSLEVFMDVNLIDE